MSVADPASSAIALVETPCPACGDTRGERLPAVPAEPPAPKGPWTLVRCAGCSSLHLQPRPADPRALYAEGYHVHRVPGPIARRVRAFASAREAARARRLIAPPADVYEIGCGTGDVLAALKRRGYRTSGIEVSLPAARAARARGLAIEEGAFDGGRGIAGGYDLVLAAHVLEHVADPHRFLADLRRILRPGGRALLKLPLAGSFDQSLFGGHSGALDVPYHLLVPSRDALVAMVRDSGLELIKLSADPVPNDWVHGIRRLLREAIGVSLPVVQPWNPLLFLPLFPLSLLSAALGSPGRVRLVLRKPPA